MVELNKDIYIKAAKNVEEMALKLVNLKDLIATLKDVGVDTNDMEFKSVELEKQIERWETVLRRKGYLD